MSPIALGPAKGWLRSIAKKQQEWVDPQMARYARKLLRYMARMEANTKQGGTDATPQPKDP